MNLEKAITTAKEAVLKTYDGYWYQVPILDDWGHPLPQEPGCADYSSCSIISISNAEFDTDFESPYEDDGLGIIGVTVTVDWQWTDEELEEDVKLLVPVWQDGDKWSYGDIERVD